jgi:hypothetical protein
MDRTTLEYQPLNDVTVEDHDSQVSELNDVQLALIGGGNGETILH